MPKPFDATLNALIDARPGDWADFLAARLGLPTGPADVLDTDLSTTLQADRLFRVNAPTPFVIHLELESSAALGTPERLLRYNVNAWAVAALPVHSVVVLLRPKANASDLTGTLTRAGADGQAIHTFRYDVVRLWLEPIAPLLATLGLAPLSLLTRESTRDLPAAVTRLAERLQRPDVGDKLKDAMLGASLVLGGLTHDRDRLIDLYRRLPMVNMEDSTTYMWILEQGVEKGKRSGALENARGQLLRQGAKKFGVAAPAMVARVNGLDDLEELGRLSDRLLDVATWDELFAVT